ncbi:MAG TPA: DUF2087 domain-containing protein [Actinomycetota bacterium]|nr:DUF2087 domain-containing protein [Actinomycetota bacterium]
MFEGDADRIVAALADPDRLRVAAALVLGANTVAELGDQTGLEGRALEKAISRLTAAGLVTKHRDGYRFASEEILEAARAAGERRSAEQDLGLAPSASSVLRTFIRGGRLITIPAVRSKRLVVLDHLAQEFEPGMRYSEALVNEVLRQYHDDVASLRRHLVDEGFMEREGGKYWRAGGTFPVR